MPERTIATARYEKPLLLLLIVCLAGWHTLGGFWRGDDSAILVHAMKYSLFDIFVVPAAWQEISAANLTPWMSLSLYVDYALAGMQPWFFYLHHLVALWLASVAAMHLMTRFSNAAWGFFGAALFVLGTPVLRISDQLYTRHYLEGLLLCLVALNCFLHYRGNGKVLYQVAAVLCYAGAMTAKEVYVPLGIVFVFLTAGSWPERLRQVWPHLALLALYASWRAYMLSGYVGGYASFSSYLEPAYWVAVITSFLNIPTLLFGDLMPFIAVPFFGAIIAGFSLKPRTLPWLLLIGALVCGPLVPLVAYPGITSADRYLLLPWLALCFAFAVHGRVVVESLPAQRFTLAARVVCIALLALLLIHRERVRLGEHASLVASDTQMRFIWNNDASRAFEPDPAIAANFWMVRTLGEIKQLFDPEDSMPKPVTDTIFLDASLPLYSYSADCSCMQDVSATIPERLAQLLQARNSEPLSLTISNDDGWFVWNFGPYTSGRYNVVSDYVGNVPLPPMQSGLRTNIRRDIDFYLRYTAPEGWVSYSPLLHLTSDGKELTWSRD